MNDKALAHAADMVAEAKREVLVRLQTRIIPKIGDARLYMNRPEPRLEQVARLLDEMERALQTV